MTETRKAVGKEPLRERRYDPEYTAALCKAGFHAAAEELDAMMARRASQPEQPALGAGATWRVGAWGDGSTPFGLSNIFCDAWEVTIAAGISTQHAMEIVEAHNASLTAPPPSPDVDVPALLASHENLRLAYNKAVADLADAMLRFAGAKPSPDVVALQAVDTATLRGIIANLREERNALQAENERLTAEASAMRAAKERTIQALLAQRRAAEAQVAELREVMRKNWNGHVWRSVNFAQADEVNAALSRLNAGEKK